MYNIIWYFFIYAFLGWVVEVIYAAVHNKKFINRGFLTGPICPIYGFGIILVIFSLKPFEENLLLLFIGAFILTSVVEYVTGYILSVIFKNRWWDYNDELFNLHGYICLKFSIIWGMTCVLVVKIAHPFITWMVDKINKDFGIVILVILGVLFIIDIIHTVNVIALLNKKLAMIAGLGNMLKKEIEEKIYEELLNKKIKGLRLFRAFPTMTSVKYKEAMTILKKEIEKFRKLNK
jgi:uncharacterized membrane protein